MAINRRGLFLTQIVNVEAVETGANSPASLKDITTPWTILPSALVFLQHLHVPNMQAILPPRREVLVFGTGGSFSQIDMLQQLILTIPI
jgi:hypothetical protein